MTSQATVLQGFSPSSGLPLGCRDYKWEVLGLLQDAPSILVFDLPPQ